MNQSVKRIDVKGPHGTWSYEAPSWVDRFPIVMGDIVMVAYLKRLMNH